MIGELFTQRINAMLGDVMKMESCNGTPQRGLQNSRVLKRGLTIYTRI